MDAITINDLEVVYTVGVPDAERLQPQRLLLTVTLESDFTAAAAGDDLSQAIDYGAVCLRLQSLGRDRSWKLIERLAVEIAELLLTEFKPLRVSVEVRKFILPQTRYVSARVTRERTTVPSETAHQRITRQVGGVPAGWR
jgi:dihydroneopterin aldolase